MHMMDYGCWSGYGGGVFMWFIFLILIVIVLYVALRSPKSGTSQAQETPLDILKKRYAKGEISKEEFEKIKKDLSE